MQLLDTAELQRKRPTELGLRESRIPNPNPKPANSLRLQILIFQELGLETRALH